MTSANYITDGHLKPQLTAIKRCVDCGAVKPISMFQYRKDTKRKTGYYHSKCRSCDREYRRAFEERRREERDFLRLLSVVGKPPCDACPSKIACRVECDEFKAYAEGV